MSLEDQVNAAISRRAKLSNPDTNVLRLVNGAGDGLDELVIDDFAGRWLMSIKEGSTAPKLSPELGFRSLYAKALSKNEKNPPWCVGGDEVTGRFTAQEQGLSYWIDFQTGFSQGLFLDQRNNRGRLRELCPGKTVLNTFAYTCSFGVAAEFAGAKTVNLDLSRNYLDWGQENYRLNGIEPDQTDFIYGDVFDWLARFAKRGRQFDIVVLDPPTFSRSRTSGVFRAEQDYSALLERALRVVNPGGILLCCLNTHQVSAVQFRNVLRANLPTPVDLRASPMPEDFRGSDYLKSFWVFL